MNRTYPPNIVILASGNGSNAQRIAEYFAETRKASVSLILCNNPSAYVLQRARILEIPSVVFSLSDFYETDVVLNILQEAKPALIVLAGFLWLVPEKIIDQYPKRIINIHPALLPDFGGKGMYGMKVHQAVIASGHKESGITIHYVNPRYDEGDIIFQVRCPVLPGDTPETLAQRIHLLEYEHYPVIIGKLLSDWSS